MKSSTAFTGMVLVVLATGALIGKAIKTHGSGSFSDGGLLAKVDRLGEKTRMSSPTLKNLAPDSASVSRVSGAFMPNLGQVRSDIYFELRTSRRLAYFRATTIGIYPSASRGPGSEPADGVDIHFLGANRRPEVAATRQAAIRLAFRGGDAGNEFTASIPTFAEIKYADLYNGVELRVSASESAVVRRFVVKPGTPVSEVLMHYDGAGDPILLPSGELSIPTNDDMLKYPRPSAFQNIEGRVVPVAVAYSLGRYGAFGFRVGDYDTSLPLVIEAEGV